MDANEYLAIKRERIQERHGDLLASVNVSPAVKEAILPLLEAVQKDLDYMAESRDRAVAERNFLRKQVIHLETHLKYISEIINSAVSGLGTPRYMGVDPASPKGDYTVIGLRSGESWQPVDIQVSYGPDAWELKPLSISDKDIEFIKIKEWLERMIITGWTGKR